MVFDFINKLTEVEARRPIRFPNDESISKNVESIIVCENVLVSKMYSF